MLSAESELSEGDAGVAGVAGDAPLASNESSVHDVVVSSFTESTANLPGTNSYRMRIWTKNNSLLFFIVYNQVL